MPIARFSLLVVLLVACTATAPQPPQPQPVNVREPETKPAPQALIALDDTPKIAALKTRDLRKERIVFDKGSLALGAISMAGPITHLAYSELVLEPDPNWNPNCALGHNDQSKNGCLHNAKRWRYTARYAQMQGGALGKARDIQGLKSVAAILPTAQGVLLVGLSETNAAVTSIAADLTQGPVEEFAPGEKGFNYGLDAALDESGNLHIVWGYHKGFSNMELRYRVRTSKGQWSPLERLPTDKGVGIYPSISVTPEAIRVIGAASATAPCSTLLFTKERQSPWRVQEIIEQGGHRTGTSKNARWATASQYAGSASSLRLFDLSTGKANPAGGTPVTASGQGYDGPTPVASWTDVPVLLLPEADRVDLAGWDSEGLRRTTLHQSTQERRNAVLAVEGDHFVAAWDEVTPGIWNQIVLVSGRLSGED